MTAAQFGKRHGDPPDPLTPSAKVDRILSIVERPDLTATEKCISVGLVAKAGRDGGAEAKTNELQLFASAKDRETVFRATATLHQRQINREDAPEGPGWLLQRTPHKTGRRDRRGLRRREKWSG